MDVANVRLHQSGLLQDRRRSAVLEFQSLAHITLRMLRTACTAELQVCRKNLVDYTKECRERGRLLTIAAGDSAVFPKKVDRPLVLQKPSLPLLGAWARKECLNVLAIKGVTCGFVGPSSPQPDFCKGSYDVHLDSNLFLIGCRLAFGTLRLETARQERPESKRKMPKHIS